MRLVRISLRDFRGVRNARVEFSAGVTVVEGPNEVGKSSIAEAMRLLRTMKASSRHRDVVAVAPIGSDVGPEVELDLHTGPYELTYRKRWLKSPSTELRIHRPKPEQVSGDQAHDRFSAILAETVQIDLLDALEVIQGTSLDRPNLASIAALHRALDQTAGDLEGHDDLLARIEQEYSGYFTARGNPTGRYGRAAAEVANCKSEVARLRERSAELDSLVEQRCRHAKRCADLVGQLELAARELAEHETAANSLERLRAGLTAAEAGLSGAQDSLRHATEAKDARLELAAEIDRRAEQVVTLSATAENLAAHHQNLADQLTHAQAAAAEARERRGLARQATKAAREALENHRARTDHDTLADRVRSVRAAEARRVTATAELANAPVDEATASRLGELGTELRLAEGRRQAAAAQVLVRRLGDLPVTVGGAEVSDVQEIPALDVIQVEAPGVVTVEVRPGAHPDALEAEVTGAREALADALHAAGVESVADAHQLAARRRESRIALEKAQSALEQALSGDSLTDLEERLAALAVRLGGVSESDDLAPDPEVLAAAVEAAQRTEATAEHAVTEARAEVDRLRTATEAANLRRATAAQEENVARLELDRHSAALTQARASQDDAALAAAVAAATAAVAEQEALVGAARTALNQADPETLEIRLANARTLVAGKTAEREDASNEVARHDGLIEDRTAEGIYDRLAAAEAALAAAEESSERLTRAANAVELLRNTMLNRKAEAQRRYVAPFRERIERLGRVVFGPGFAVEISDQLTIEKRTLDGPSVPFESLSAGAREQLALLGRLACAQLVDPAEGAPVILDDTLGFSDPARLKALGAVLGDVGQSAQVVLLTCQPGRFDSLGGAKVVHLDAT